jgi:hypothetical protein
MENMETSGNPVAFPTVLNLAVTHLLDQLDAGASVVFDGNGFRLAKLEALTTYDERAPATLVALDKSAEHKSSGKAKRA